MARDIGLSALRPTVATIDLDAFERNLRSVAGRLPPGSRLIAVLKADGYGHGAIELAARCREPEVAMIAVALIEEAIELRQSGTAMPILVLGAATSEQLQIANDHQLTLGIVSPEGLRDVAAFARRKGSDTHIHLKLDSGMGRMGLTGDDLPEAIETLRGCANLVLDAVYTHFANSSDPGDGFTAKQIQNFDRMIALLRESGIDAPLHHLANSGATMSGRVRPGDYVRVGIALYGAEALDSGESRLEPVMQWTTRIARLKQIPAGGFVGYGMTFKAERPTLVATLPVGYADGYDRLLSNRGEVLIRGRRAPVIGRVSMDLITVDVTEVPDVRHSDEVVLLGRQSEETITAEEFAEKTGTISYEVFCRISARVPRSYISVNGPAAVRSRFVQR